jgi:tetratricopeptide (TPR) repeat protein
MRISFPILLFLYLMTALEGALISYNPSIAWTRFAFIAMGTASSVLVWKLFDPEQGDSGKISWLGMVLSVLPAAVVIYFVLTTEWESRVGKLPLLDPVLDALAAWRISAPGSLLNSNSLGGLLAALAPLQIAALLDRKRKLSWTGVVLFLVTAFGLLLSESRGAWFALAGVAGIWLLYKMGGQIAKRWTGITFRRVQISLVIGAVGLLLFVGTVAASSPLGQDILKSRNDRLMVWQNSLDLVRDYAFTGIGLGGFEMAYSSYVLLLHVGHTVHAHNLYLDIWLEQGMPGLLVFAGLVGLLVSQMLLRLWRGEPVTVWQGMALASLGVIFLHGVIDDPFYGYGGYGIPFLFVPFGLLARSFSGSEKSSLNLSRSRLIPIALGAGVLVAVVAFVPACRSALFANLGALIQTREELSTYSWPAWQIQDVVRRSDKIDLAPAIAQYQVALSIDPGNATANRRLGQIELSRGDYESAQRHLQAAFVAAPEQRATRQLLGEVYAITGKVDRALAIWSRIDVSNGQLAVRQWWYEHIGETDHAARIQLAAHARDFFPSSQRVN